MPKFTFSPIDAKLERDGFHRYPQTVESDRFEQMSRPRYGEAQAHLGLNDWEMAGLICGFLAPAEGWEHFLSEASKALENRSY